MGGGQQGKEAPKPAAMRASSREKVPYPLGLAGTWWAREGKGQAKLCRQPGSHSCPMSLLGMCLPFSGLTARHWDKGHMQPYSGL